MMGTSCHGDIQASRSYLLAPSSLESQHSIKVQRANCQRGRRGQRGPFRLKYECCKKRGSQACQARALHSTSRGHVASLLSMVNLPLPPS